MSDRYILKGHEAVPVADLMEWARWFEDSDRVVKQENVGEARVSTVFLGLDHNWGGGPPLIFETMVFGGDHDGEMDRYSTWEAAEVGHREMCDKVRRAVDAEAQR